MDRFNILLKKPAPKKPSENIKEVEESKTIRVAIPPSNRIMGNVSQVNSMDFDRRPEGISIQQIHPVDGDLLIISLPTARSEELDQFQDVLSERIRSLGVRCEAIVSNY